MGASFADLGLSWSVPLLIALPLMTAADTLLKGTGRVNLLVFASLFYATRMAGVSFVRYECYTYRRYCIVPYENIHWLCIEL